MELRRPQFDLFLSYASRDRARVLSLAESLAKHAGLRVFVDRWYMVPGEPWLGALERALGSCRAAAICIGPGELGPWQQREMCLALDRQSRDQHFRVIPILLPGADSVLGFLGTNMWIDLRDGAGEDEFVALLAAALRGMPRLPEVAATFQRARTSVCPYRGLLYFREEDAPFFLGREPIIAELERTAARASFVSVVGASGSGKSSVVRAGLVPRLRRSQSPVWEVTTMVPGDRPLRALAAVLVLVLEPEIAEVDLLVHTSKLAAALSAGEVSVRDVAERVLARQPGTERVLLVVDQWEELYTLTHDAGERARFIGQLLEATTHHVLSVVLTLRGDFVGQALADRRLADRLQGAQVNVGPMTEDELRRAIEQPAGAVGLSFEPGLVDLILKDVGDEPGHLPLLEFVLRQVWGQRRADRLVHDAYRQIGGLEGAIASRAEHVFESLTEREQAVLRQLFLRLARPGDGQDYTRLRALSADISDDEWPLVHRLADERLLVTSHGAIAPDRTVEVSHEALLRHWSRLKAWLDRDREFLLWRERLRAMMNAWTNRQEDGDSLLQGSFLAEAEKWRTERNADLTPSEQRYIEVSVEARTRRENEAREQAAKLAASERTSRRMLAQMYAEPGRQLLLEGRPQEAIPYLLAARESGLDDPPLRMLFHAAKRHLPLIPPLEHQRSVNSAVFSPDGTRVLTASSDNTARVWDAATGKLLTGPLEHRAPVTSAAFSSDGTRVVTASRDNTARLWDAATGMPLTGPLEHQKPVTSAAFSPDGTRVVTGSSGNSARVWDATTGQPLNGPLEHQGEVTSVAFSPDGTRVVTASSDGTARLWNAATGKPLTSPLAHPWRAGVAFSPDGTRMLTHGAGDTLQVWDAASGNPLATLEPQGRVESVAFSPDGTRLVTAGWGNTAQVWDAATGEPLATLEPQGRVESAEFSPDGKRVVTVSRDNTARVWDAATGKPLTSPLEHQDIVWGGAFSFDGTRLVTASDDNTVRVWNAVSNPHTTFDHQGAVTSFAFSPDGTRVITASDDNTARVWDTATGKPLATLEHQAEVASAAFSPDATRVVTASWDNSARVWDPVTGKSLTNPLEHRNKVWSAAFNSDGTRLVTASHDKTARVWDAATGTLLTGPLEHQEPVTRAEFSPDGARVITASWDNTARAWDALTGKLLTSFGHQGIVESVAFSPDGTRVVTASHDKTARVWDGATGKLLATLGHHGEVTSAAFSPDGARVVTAGWDKTARVWDAATGKPLTSPLEHEDKVWSAAFSPDGTRVVTASHDKTARVWDAATGKPLTSPLEHEDKVWSAAFSPDGTGVVTASLDKTARLWDVRPDQGTLDEWSAIAQWSPYYLEGSVLVPRSKPEKPID